jgi:parallel beta-helix repeat protein
MKRQRFFGLILTLALLMTSSGVTRLCRADVGLPAPADAFPGQASDTTYYVDFDGGDDASDGLTESMAWQHAPGDPQATGNPASVELQPGDTVLFKGGVAYRGQIAVDASGVPGNPITFSGSGWGGEKAILDGSETLAGWTRCESQAACGDNPNWENIYYAYAPAEVTNPMTVNLHENDEFLWLAQELDQPDPFFMDNLEYFYSIPPASVTRTSIVDPLRFDQSDEHYWDNSYVLVWRIPNVVTLRRITGFVPAEDKITFDDLGGDPYDDRDTKYSIYNSIHALDQPGEYYFNPEAELDGAHKIYLWPRDAADLSQQAITYSVRNYGINIKGNSYVNIEGLVVQKFSGDGVAQGIGLGTVTHRYFDILGIVIRDNIVRHNRYGSRGGYGGIHVASCSNCLVENNLVEENPLHRGIFFTNGYNIIIRNNTVNKAGSTSISFYTCTFSRIVNNLIENSLGGHANGISLYLSSSDILVAYNMIFDSSSPLTFQGINNLTVYGNIIDAGNRGNNVNEWSGGSTGAIAFLNNVLTRNDRNAALNLGGVGATYIVMNNVIDGGGWRSGASEPVTHTHNIYTGLRWDQDVEDLGEGEFLEEDLGKIFVDPANADFRLKVGSLAVDAGTDVTPYLPTDVFPDFDFTLDLAGKLRPQGFGWDIGAYEFVPSLQLYGTPANEAIHLNWTVNITLPLTSTWQIDYYTQTVTAPFTATIPLSVTRSYTLTEHVDNYQWYTVTLHAMLGETSWLSDTVRVMPTDRFVYLPLVLR